MSLLESLGLLVAAIAAFGSLTFAALSGVEHRQYITELRNKDRKPNTFAWNHHKWFRIFGGIALGLSLICIALLLLNREAFEQFVTNHL